MGNFSNNAITDVGRMLLADVQAGAVFTPTRIVIGSGSMTGGATVQGMTDVITPVKSLTINKKKRTPDGKCVFGGVYTNEEVTEPFYFRELALYAKAVYLNEDGSVKSEGAETLYSYGNAGATADYMPAYSTSTVVEKQMDLVIWVGNDTQVDLTIESGVYVTQEQAVLNIQYIRPDTVGFDSLLEYMVSIYPKNIIVSGHISGFSDMPEDVTILHGTINVVGGQLTVFGTSRTDFYFRGTNSLTEWTSEWQSTAPGGFGLGGYPQKEVSLSELDSIFDTGWYILSQYGTNLSGVGFNYGNVLVHCTANQSCVQELRILGSNIVLRRHAHLNEWSEWEVENPPFDLDVEYRTTERRNNKAVYKKLSSDGVLRYRLEGDSTWYTYAQENGAAPATHIHKVYDTNTNEAVDAAIEAELMDMPSHSIRHICVSDNVGSTIFFGGMTHITINKVTDEYASVEAIRYHTSGVLMWKRCKYVTWLGWEWVNPPLDTGYEYRTTERYHGYAVIKKMDASGNILWRAEHETSWRLLASASVVAPATVE